MSQTPLPAATAPAFNPWVAVCQILIVGSLWGSAFSVAKFAIGAGVPPVAYAFWQCFGAGILLLAMVLLRGESMPLNRRHLSFYLMTGLFGIGIPNMNFYLVIEHIPAGLMAIVITTAPMLTFLIALGTGLERFRWLRMAGILLGFAGVLILLIPGGGGSAGVSQWVLMALITPLAYAIGSTFTARFRPPGLSALSAATGMMLSAASLQFPIMLAVGHDYLPLLEWNWRDAAIGGHVVISTVAYVTYFHLVRLAGPVYFSQVGYVVTLTGIVWGMIFFGERLSSTIYLATAVLLAGIALVNLGNRGAKSG